MNPNYNHCNVRGLSWPPPPFNPSLSIYIYGKLQDGLQSVCLFGVCLVLECLLVMQCTESGFQQLWTCCRSVRDERFPWSIRVTETGGGRWDPNGPQRHLVLTGQWSDASHLPVFLAFRSVVAAVLFFTPCNFRVRGHCDVITLHWWYFWYFLW